jgi:hypothetical protein
MTSRDVEFQFTLSTVWCRTWKYCKVFLSHMDTTECKLLSVLLIVRLCFQFKVLSNCVFASRYRHANWTGIIPCWFYWILRINFNYFHISKQSSWSVVLSHIYVTVPSPCCIWENRSLQKIVLLKISELPRGLRFSFRGPYVVHTWNEHCRSLRHSSSG